MLKMLNLIGEDITETKETECALYVYIDNEQDAIDFIVLCNRHHDKAYGIDLDSRGWYMWDESHLDDCGCVEPQYVQTCAEAINMHIRIAKH